MTENRSDKKYFPSEKQHKNTFTAAEEIRADNKTE